MLAESGTIRFTTQPRSVGFESEMALARFDDLTPGGSTPSSSKGSTTSITAHKPARCDRRSAPSIRPPGTVAGPQGTWRTKRRPVSIRRSVSQPRSDGSAVPVVRDLPGASARTSPFTPRVIRPAPYHISGWRTAVDQAAHAEAIAAIRQYIDDGDTYQVNYTFQLLAAFSGDPYELYRDLVFAQRGAFGAYLDTGQAPHRQCLPGAVLSPEWRRDRGATDEGDDRHGAAGPRGRAHAAAADPIGQGPGREPDDRRPAAQRSRPGRRVRNRPRRRAVCPRALRDRVAAHVADLRGAPRDVTLEDIFVALFPSGSVTGAPKKRTTEIIAELERLRGVCTAAPSATWRPARRPARRCRFNVAIRTVTIDTEKGRRRTEWAAVSPGTRSLPPSTKKPG